MKNTILLLFVLFSYSCVSSKANKITVVGAGSQPCYKSKGKYRKTKAYHIRRNNPTMKIKF